MKRICVLEMEGVRGREETKEKETWRKGGFGVLGLWPEHSGGREACVG